MAPGSGAAVLKTPPEEVIRQILAAAADQRAVQGATHSFYKYPARFSPVFASSVVQALSRPGDLVLDPYMGGGTTVVETMLAGRRAVGSDINSLSVFLAGAKTAAVSVAEIRQIEAWLKAVDSTMSYRRKTRRGSTANDVRTRNLDGGARSIRKVLGNALGSLTSLPSEAARQFVRCVLLKSSQWALDGRREFPTLVEFRERVRTDGRTMLGSISSFAAHAVEAEPPCLIHDSAANLPKYEPFLGGGRADLVVTSPPYPGIHVLYHRWQVLGRRETPAPYWIASRTDGHGAAHYGFGDRSEPDQAGYFSQLASCLRGIRAVTKRGAFFVQMVSFKDPKAHLRRFLECMSDAGFTEICTAFDDQSDRFWRPVPGRKWHAAVRGKTSASAETVLIHRAD
jgi:hypothetical protein